MGPRPPRGPTVNTDTPMHVRRHMIDTRRPQILLAAHGQAATEYAFLLALLVLVVIGVLPFFANTVLGLFNQFRDAFGG